MEIGGVFISQNPQLTKLELYGIINTLLLHLERMVSMTNNLIQKLFMIHTIDLWTTSEGNSFDEFDQAFASGATASGLPYDHYIVARHCNTRIRFSDNRLKIAPKPSAVIFLKQNRPIRLLLSDAVTDINTYICHALVQRIGKSSLRVLFDKFGVTYEEIDLGCENTQSAPSLPYETAVYSCDRFELLKQYLNQPPLSILNLRFNPTIELSLSLSVPQIEFHIQHQGGFISEGYRHFIPLQISHRLMTII